MMLTDTPRLVPGGSAEPVWAGMRVHEESLDFSLVGPDGATIDRTQVANTHRAVLRLVRHWRKTRDVDPALIVFCTDRDGLSSGAVLHWMMDRGWTVVLFDAARADGSVEEEQGPADVEAMVRWAMRSPRSVEVMSVSRLHTLKLEQLRSRRDRLVALRSDLHGEMASRRTMFEEELAREFERLDRRHVQVIDKIILRLDALIGLQMRGG